MVEYHSKNRHKFLIKLHIIFVAKYRKRLLVNDLSDDIKQWCYDVCNKNNVKIDEMETDKDHLLVDIPPTLAPSKLVMLLKQQTTFNSMPTIDTNFKDETL
jgi:putative transposase